jgi:RNA polymerase sigma factor (sigma-70 family)
MPTQSALMLPAVMLSPMHATTVDASSRRSPFRKAAGFGVARERRTVAATLPRIDIDINPEELRPPDTRITCVVMSPVLATGLNQTACAGLPIPMADLDPEEFCARMLPRLVRSMSLYAGDRGAAEDIAQEALARAWERWDRVAVMESPEAWVFMTARNLANRRWRRIRRRAATVQPGVEPVHPDDVDALAVRLAVSHLPERQKTTLIARYFLGLSVAETAHALGCAEGTVKAATHQAIERLRRDGFLAANDEVEVI